MFLLGARRDRRRITRHGPSSIFHLLPRLVAAAATLAPTAARASTCWTPNIRQETDTSSDAHPQTSKVITLEWDTYDTDCDDTPGFGNFDHFRIEMQATCPATWSAGDGILTHELTGRLWVRIHELMWRAEFPACFAIFPCDDSTPSVCLGDAELDSYFMTTEAATLPERWVAVGIQESGTTHIERIADTSDSEVPQWGPEVLKGDPMWGGDQANALNIFAWDKETEADGVYVRLASSTGWADFNTLSFDDPILVLQNSDLGTPAGDWKDIGFSWARQVKYDSSGSRAMLLAVQLGQSDIGADGAHGLMLSAEESVEDFALECLDTGDCDASECT